MASRHSHYDTSLGTLLITASDDAVTGVYFEGHTYPPESEAMGDDLGPESADPLLEQAATQLREYLAGDRTLFDISIDPVGDDFSQKVWAMLREIPYGETVTYGSLALRLGNRGLAQRVGQAVGHNPVSIIIPCHRVLGADGSLTGYAGGLDRKRALLALEEPDAEFAGRLF